MPETAPIADPTYDYRRITATDINGRPITTGGEIVTTQDLILHQQSNWSAPQAQAFPVPRDADLFVYGDVVRIRGPDRGAGKTILIVCRVLEAVPASRPAAIIVDGAAGARPPGGFRLPASRSRDPVSDLPDPSGRPSHRTGSGTGGPAALADGRGRCLRRQGRRHRNLPDLCSNRHQRRIVEHASKHDHGPSI